MASIKSSPSLLVLEVDMFKWFKYLFHLHEWETIKETRLNIYDEIGQLEDTGTRYILRCKTCGHITKRDMI